VWTRSVLSRLASDDAVFSGCLIDDEPIDAGTQCGAQRRDLELQGQAP
jgi:hypothetical protein